MGFDPFINVLSPKVSMEQVGKLVPGSMKKEGQIGGMGEKKLKSLMSTYYTKSSEHASLFMHDYLHVPEKTESSHMENLSTVTWLAKQI